jgi:hypothetical protein
MEEEERKENLLGSTHGRLLLRRRHLGHGLVGE